jgi:predicted signal transduction protein with EAL and GGDEF domain
MIRRTLTTPITYAEREIFLTASIGLVLHDPQAIGTREEMLKSAEIAMMHAKRQGGDRIEVFRPSMRADRNDKLNLGNDLQRAYERGDIKVLFKPVVRLEDRTIAGFEAVLRWDHPRLGRWEPKDFLPVAEETGLIVNLSVYTLERTARELAAWQQALEVDPPIFASVRMASHQLLRHDLLQDVKATLARTGVLPGSLKLEMTRVS